MEKEKDIPNHVAIIPDGNRRWAKQNNLEPWEGHEAGANNIEKLVRKALELGVSCISFWGSSINNLEKRPIKERQALLRIYEEYFLKLIDSNDIHDNEVRVHVIGKWKEQLPEKLVKILETGIEKTKNYQKNNLVFFLAYNGDDEMIEAIKNIVKKGIGEKDITAETIKENLMTKDLPSVDYLIRTGGDPHLSVGFMMWDTANSQLYFPEMNFPDFNEVEFEKAVEEYQERERRHGK